VSSLRRVRGGPCDHERRLANPCKDRLTNGKLPAVAVAVQNAFCADVSTGSSEALAATASRVDHWILVEYRGLWDRDVLGGSLLSEELKTHLREQLGRLPHSRLLFVKKPERRAHGRRQLFFGSSRPGEERFYGLEFDRHDDLVGLDLASALRDGGTPGVPVEHALFVVCTHGKRDRCCAKYGRPLYDALRRELDPECVWQSTHVGGDRFAGNVVCLPDGLYFGRVPPDGARPLVADYLAGRLRLEYYRGRSFHTFPVQAAEQRVREETGLVGIDDVAFAAIERAGEEAWTVRLHAGGALHEIDVAAERADEAVYLTCGAATPQHPRRFEATAHRVL
jgi:hypothetical protein